MSGRGIRSTIWISSCPGEEGVVPGIVEKNEGVEYIRADVRQPLTLDFTPTAEDVIFNLAAVYRTPGHPDEAYFETNILGAEHVTAFAEKYGIRKILFTSSIAPYGASEDLKTEETLPTPNTPYGISKLVAEKIHQIWQARDPARELTIVRPGIDLWQRGARQHDPPVHGGRRRATFFMPAGRTPSRRASMSRSWCASSSTGCWIIPCPGAEIYNCTYEPAYTIEEICDTMQKATGLHRHVPLVPAGLLLFAAGILGPIGGKKGGYPSRPCPEADGIHQCLRQKAGRH